ncbi:hypothetical protein ON010_g10103 [Phytophthora cinnamomi]|nr:hypothetical protein ON010_g10103 [Phytophthora cinnamomi]
MKVYALHQRRGRRVEGRHVRARHESAQPRGYAILAVAAGANTSESLTVAAEEKLSPPTAAEEKPSPDGAAADAEETAPTMSPAEVTTATDVGYDSDVVWIPAPASAEAKSTLSAMPESLLENSSESETEWAPAGRFGGNSTAQCSLDPGHLRSSSSVFERML